MTRQEIIDFCLTFPNSYEDYPFDKIEDIGVWTVMRHLLNKKTFAMIYERNGKLCINLKCDPHEADLLRQVYKDLTPAYHMNKRHWNTITLGTDCDVPTDELWRTIEHSYDLIKPKLKNRRTKK